MRTGRALLYSELRGVEADLMAAHYHIYEGQRVTASLSEEILRLRGEGS